VHIFLKERAAAFSPIYCKISASSDIPHTYSTHRKVARVRSFGRLEERVILQARAFSTLLNARGLKSASF
jgi:hypothetical protein